MDNYTDEELNALEVFRPNAEKIVRNPTNQYLIRWLRARELDQNKAEEMLRNAVQWRNEVEIRKTLEWTPPKILSDDFKYQFTGHDLDHRPVLVVPIGKWNIRKMLEMELKENAFKTAHKLLEEIQEEIDKTKNATQFIIILDSSDMSFRKVAHLETIDCILQYFRTFESCYPEILFKAYVINAPWVFTYIFNFIKPLLSMRTLSKVQIFGAEKNWKPVILKDLPINVIPENYGGSYPVCFKEPRD